MFMYQWHTRLRDMRRCIAIAGKDLTAEFRTKQMLNSMLVFALLIILIFSFSFRDSIGDYDRITELAPGILWITFIFAGMLGLSRSFSLEQEENCIEGLKLCPVDRSVIYVGKMLSNLVLMVIMELVAIPIFMVLFNYTLTNIFWLALVVLLGTIGFLAVGTLLSALTLNTQARELLLPVIMFPVIFPLIMALVPATAKVLAGDYVIPELRILCVFDIVFFVAATVVFEYAIE
jgi:heme exporter protein B